MRVDRNRGICRWGAVALAGFALLAFAGPCPAAPYHPEAALSVQSEYSAFKSAGRPHTQVWRIVPESGPSGRTLLRFFPEAAPGAAALCEISIPGPGGSGAIEWTGASPGQQKSGAGLLLLAGFPAPCDVLPAVTAEGGATYPETVEAGGRVFVRNYRVSAAAMAVAEARAMGYLRTELAAGALLIMVSVTDEAGRPMVKQLWSADGAWWLFEETPVRRSWLIP